MECLFAGPQVYENSVAANVAEKLKQGELKLLIGIIIIN